MPKKIVNMEATTDKKKDNTALYIVYAAAAYFGLQFLMKPKRAAAATIQRQLPAIVPATNTSTAYETYVPEVSKWIAESFPLRKGMQGNNIKALQRKVGVAADGAFGDKTENALLLQYGISTVSQAQFKTITSGASQPASSPVQNTTAINKWVAESFPLRKGMKGNTIKTLQQKLGVPADGAFGNNTEAALLQKYGITTVSQAQLQSIIEGKQTNTTVVTNNTVIKWINESFPLKKGMKGNAIKLLQQHLGLPADGAFGNNTEMALLQRYGVKTVTQAQFSIFTGKAANAPAAAASSEAIKWVAERFPLQYGMKGNNIRLLQLKMGLVADGAFGITTQSAILMKFGATSVDQALFQKITQTTPASTSVFNMLLPKAATAADNSTLLKNGSRGQDVYRLQKWLGFKDRSAAKKGELIADSIFGSQTVSALQRKTGKSSITVNELNKLIKPLAGVGYLGETLITKRSAIVFDNSLQPYRHVPEQTILGTRIMELKDPAKRKAYTQFRSIDGIRRWIETDAL